MSARTGRNEPCPCGSGKKYKQCCEQKSAESAVSSGRGGLLVLALILVTGGVAATFLALGGDPPTDAGTARGRPASSTPASGTGNRRPTNPLPTNSLPTKPLTPQPPGPPPPGKVWSPEHGHWHDIR